MANVTKQNCRVGLEGGARKKREDKQSRERKVNKGSIPSFS